jgi:hypothetical protein
VPVGRGYKIVPVFLQQTELGRLRGIQSSVLLVAMLVR